MRKNDSGGLFDYPFSELVSPRGMDLTQALSGDVAVVDGRKVSRGVDESLQQVLLNAAMTALELDVPGEDVATRLAFFGSADGFLNRNTLQGDIVAKTSGPVQDDTVYSFRASFCGFSCSLIDAAPSEIALATLKDVDVFAKWNKNRTTDASVLISVGSLQVDNFVPSAPFPVAVCPHDARSEHEMAKDDESQRKEESSHAKKPSPLLLIGLVFAPEHKSGILVSICWV